MTEWTQTTRKPFNQWLRRRSNLALCFFVVSVSSLAVATCGAWLLIRASTFSSTPERFLFPPAFAVSTLTLIAGSLLLQNASLHVRCERQRLFRRRMIQAFVIGVIFVAVQTQGLWCLIAQKGVIEKVGLRDGAFAFVFMHGVHFVVALLFVAFTLLQGLADRYDHEYSWPVTFCTWFWHALGIAWMAIAGGFLIAAAAPV